MSTFSIIIPIGSIIFSIAVAILAFIRTRPQQKEVDIEHKHIVKFNDISAYKGYQNSDMLEKELTKIVQYVLQD